MTHQPDRSRHRIAPFHRIFVPPNQLDRFPSLPIIEPWRKYSPVASLWRVQNNIVRIFPIAHYHSSRHSRNSRFPPQSWCTLQSLKVEKCQIGREGNLWAQCLHVLTTYMVSSLTCIESTYKQHWSEAPWQIMNRRLLLRRIFGSGSIILSDNDVFHAFQCAKRRRSIDRSIYHILLRFHVLFKWNKRTAALRAESMFMLPTFKCCFFLCATFLTNVLWSGHAGNDFCWRATLSQWIIIVRFNYLQEACSKKVTMATYVIKVTDFKYDL